MLINYDIAYMNNTNTPYTTSTGSSNKDYNKMVHNSSSFSNNNVTARATPPPIAIGGGANNRMHNPLSSPYHGTNFPQRLHDMLQHVTNSNLEHIVSWSSDGKSFQVHDQDTLVKDVLPLFFCQTKYRSFRRQLNMWHFKRILYGPNRGAFEHPYFIKDQKSICKDKSRDCFKCASSKQSHINELFLEISNKKKKQKNMDIIKENATVDKNNNNNNDSGDSSNSLPILLKSSSPSFLSSVPTAAKRRSTTPRRTSMHVSASAPTVMPLVSTSNSNCSTSNANFPPRPAVVDTTTSSSEFDFDLGMESFAGRSFFSLDGLTIDPPPLSASSSTQPSIMPMPLLPVSMMPLMPLLPVVSIPQPTPIAEMIVKPSLIDITTAVPKVVTSKAEAAAAASIIPTGECLSSVFE